MSELDVSRTNGAMQVQVGNVTDVAVNTHIAVHISATMPDSLPTAAANTVHISIPNFSREKLDFPPNSKPQ
jgi:hypothetical protein